MRRGYPLHRDGTGFALCFHLARHQRRVEGELRRAAAGAQQGGTLLAALRRPPQRQPQEGEDDIEGCQGTGE